MSGLTTSEAASLLHTDTHTVRWWCRLGRLKARKVGNTVWIIDRKSVESFVRRKPGPTSKVKKEKPPTPKRGGDNGAASNTF